MMVVVNRLPLAKPIDAELLTKIQTDFLPGISQLLGFKSFQLVRSSEAEAVVIVHYEDAASMRDIGTNYASPWFLSHVRPYLAGQGQRTVGELICNS